MRSRSYKLAINTGKFFVKKISLTSLLIVLLVVIWTNKYYKFWGVQGRIIAYDVAEYYQYLPALFVYHDLSLGFASADTEFFKDKVIGKINKKTGRKTGKMSIGMAYLYAPFFLTAHYTASWFGYENNGYTVPYEVGLLISSILFLGLGLFALRKVLLRYYTEKIAAFTILIIGLATNLYFYSTIEAAMPHAYSFSLITSFLYLLIKWLDRPSVMISVLLGFAIGLIILIRPSNIFILVLIPLWEVTTWRSLMDRISLLLRSYHFLILILIGVFLVFLPQLLYWKYATDQYIYYSYGNESFFFNSPAFANGLLSYRKGWLVYTPVMVFSLLGLIVMFYNQRKLFIPIAVYIIPTTYVMFSWWCWWYGGGFGMRPMIDTYGILALPVAAFTQWVWRKKLFIKILYSVVIVWFIFLNLFQTRQYYYVSIHWDGMSRAAYWESFLRLRPSDKFHTLLARPDYRKALEGVNRTTRESRKSEKQ